MGWIDKAERRFGKWAVSNLTVYMLLLQSLGFALSYTNPEVVERLWLSGGNVLGGEWYRLFSFMMIPPCGHPLLIFFAFYLFYLMGSGLEGHWGTFRYNLFILIAYLATVLVAFAVPGQIMTNHYIGGSVFLAFAFLFPDFELHLFFILPVKIKWLALLTWILYGLGVLFGGWATRLAIVASVVNFLIFFGRDIRRNIKYGHKRMKTQSKRIVTAQQAFHVCTECGITDKTNPEAEFRYCSICNQCFCSDHLHTHTHN